MWRLHKNFGMVPGTEPADSWLTSSHSGSQRTGEGGGRECPSDYRLSGGKGRWILLFMPDPSGYYEHNAGILSRWQFQKCNIHALLIRGSANARRERRISIDRQHFFIGKTGCIMKTFRIRTCWCVCHTEIIQCYGERFCISPDKSGNQGVLSPPDL